MGRAREAIPAMNCGPVAQPHGRQEPRTSCIGALARCRLLEWPRNCRTQLEGNKDRGAGRRVHKSCLRGSWEHPDRLRKEWRWTAAGFC